MTILKYILAAIAGYLLGSLSFSLLLTRLRYGKDIRDCGSGNAGATNTARVFGLGAGLWTLAGDMAKTAAAGLLGRLLGGELGLSLALAACLLGHCFPVYHGFRGGKGVSVSGCIALMLDWRMFLIVLAVFGLAAVLSGRVSLGSVTAALAFPWAYLVLPGKGFDSAFWLCCLVTVLVIFLHRANISRLIHGTEPKFKPGKKDK